MPVHPARDATTYDLHGARFDSYVSPRRGSTQLCAWKVHLPARTIGAAHTVSHEEVLLVLEGAPTVTLDGEAHALQPGDVVHVPAGGSLQLDNPGSADASLWVATSVGLTAKVAGERISPPWTR